MKLVVAAAWQKGKSPGLAAAAAYYTERLQRFGPLVTPMYRSAELLLRAGAQFQEKTPALLVLLDPRGRTMASEHFAGWLAGERDRGRQAIFFGVGGADGWTEEQRASADLLLSFGPMTLPHELARVVLLEQLYRAFTILAGHPYHAGHG